MADSNFAVNANSVPQKGLSQEWDIKSLMEKVLELQDLLLQAQEKNLFLSAQARELERAARDSDDLKAELTAQALILADKTRENKSLHQEFSRISNLLDAKVREAEELKIAFADLQHQLKSREQERDILTVMLNEMENAQKRERAAEDGKRALEAINQQETTVTSKEQVNTGGWLRHFKGRPQ
jgi:hypothetical protein